MEIYKNINLYLKDKKISKKEFAHQLLKLEPKLVNTGEIPSINTIYAYLSGRIGIKIELIPYIAEVLDIPEQFLFDDSSRARMGVLKHIFKDLKNEEKEFLLRKLGMSKETEETPLIPRDIVHSINDLLIYAPEIFLRNIEKALKDYKALTDKLNRNFKK